MAKSKWLQEVEDDATRIAQRRFDAYFEEQQYQKEKAERAAKPVQPVQAAKVVEDVEPAVKVSEKKGKK